MKKENREPMQQIFVQDRMLTLLSRKLACQFCLKIVTFVVNIVLL